MRGDAALAALVLTIGAIAFLSVRELLRAMITILTFAVVVVQ